MGNIKKKLDERRIRWAIWPKDGKRILQIEKASFANPLWKTRAELLASVRKQPNEIMWSVVLNGMDIILGFLLDELGENQRTALRIAVDPCVRNKGVGSILLDRIKDPDKPGANLFLPLENMSEKAVLFFRKNGFEPEKEEQPNG